MEEIQNILEKLSIPYHAKSLTPGQGACFYEAIIDQVNNNPTIKATIHPRASDACSDAYTLRQMFLHALKEDSDLLNDDFQIIKDVCINAERRDDESSEETYNRMIGEQSKPNAWVDHFFTEAMALFLNKDIKYISPHQPWNTLDGGSNSQAPPITLLYLNTNPETAHYQSIHPIVGKCAGCGASVKYIRSHLAKKPACKIFYNMDEINKEARNKIREQQASYRERNRTTLRAKQNTYDKQNRDKKAEYNKIHQDHIRERQQKYNEAHRDQICEKQRSYDKSHKHQIQKKQRIYDESHADQIREKQKRYNQENQGKINFAQAFRRSCNIQNASEKTRLTSFKREIQHGLSFPCFCCHRVFFINGVSNINYQKFCNNINNQDPEFLEKAILLPIPGKCYVNGNLYLCHTCNRSYLQKLKCPPTSAINGLQLDKIPEDLELSELENCLIAKKILFIKIFKLPVSRWTAMKDRVINVPIEDNDLLQTLETLNNFPRNFDSAGLIPVELKRKVGFKNTVLEAYINPDKLLKAIKILQSLGHPGYKDININSDAIRYDLRMTPTNDTSSENSSLSSNEGSDSSDNEDNIQQYHFKATNESMMTENYPESNLVTNLSKKTLQHKTRDTSKVSCPIAPGEGKIPTNIMRESDWDIMAFPHLHPSGNYGLSYKRSKKLPAQQYFLQRLQNIDPRFRNSKPFVFASTYFLERGQLERQINISGQRGTLNENKLLQIEDGFSVFDRVTGTPRYWRNKRYEMVAKLENLGPFHFFFTLSCADKRWQENFVSILIQRGHRITFKDEMAYVNDQPIEEYLENENLHDLIKDHVLTMTRNFDRRVHAFVKNIIMGSNSPMHVKFYNYRVEFQVRGAGHIHGVLWLDTEALNETFPGLSTSLSKIKDNETLTDKEKATCINFVDSFITVSLRNDLKSTVEEVQVHKHSKSCRKYGTSCRFSYPKFPSNRTIIAQPLDKTKFPSESAFKKKLQSLKDNLASVKRTLEKLEDIFPNQEQVTIQDILTHSKVTEEQYYEALSISACGTTIILQRSVQERFVNNYNQEWLRAWNATSIFKSVLITLELSLTSPITC